MREPVSIFIYPARPLVAMRYNVYYHPTAHHLWAKLSRYQAVTPTLVSQLLGIVACDGGHKGFQSLLTETNKVVEFSKWVDEIAVTTTTRRYLIRSCFLVREYVRWFYVCPIWYCYFTSVSVSGVPKHSIIMFLWSGDHLVRFWCGSGVSVCWFVFGKVCLFPLGVDYSKQSLGSDQTPTDFSRTFWTFFAPLK